MSKFVRSIVHEADFDGDHVKITLKPLTFTDLMFLQSKVPDGEAEMLISFMGMIDRYVTKIEGATDSEGQPIQASDLNSAYWAPLVADLVVRILEEAQVKDPT